MIKRELLFSLESTIHFMKEGNSLPVGDFVLERSDTGRVRVNGYISVYYIENISKPIGNMEFPQMKEEFITLMDQSEKFKRFALAHGIDYYLLYDTGKAGIEVCSEIDGVFKFSSVVR